MEIAIRRVRELAQRGIHAWRAWLVERYLADPTRPLQTKFAEVEKHLYRQGTPSCWLTHDITPARTG